MWSVLFSTKDHFHCLPYSIRRRQTTFETTSSFAESMVHFCRPPKAVTLSFVRPFVPTMNKRFVLWTLMDNSSRQQQLHNICLSIIQYQGLQTTEENDSPHLSREREWRRPIHSGLHTALIPSAMQPSAWQSISNQSPTTRHFQLIVYKFDWLFVHHMGKF